MCFLRELGSVYLLVQPGLRQAYGFWRGGQGVRSDRAFHAAVLGCTWFLGVISLYTPIYMYGSYCGVKYQIIAVTRIF